MIRIGDSDTDLPRNIYDDEFDEDSPSLPPARPASEATPVSYMITKSRLAFGFGKVLEEMNGVKSHSYEDILKIDSGLREIYDSIPDHLRLRPMSEQTLAPVQLIMARFSLASLYHKAQCVLHRRYLRSARTNARYACSRRTCLDSAMTLLNFQSIQYQETRNKGRFRSLRRFVDSLTTTDFLLAGTIISVELYHNRDRVDFNNASTPNTVASSGCGSQRNGSVGSGHGMGVEYSQEDLVKALERSRDIWDEIRDESMEAYKASELISTLLKTLRCPPERDGPNQAPFYLVEGAHVENAVDEKQNAAMTLGLLSSGGVSSSPQTQNLGPQQQSRNIFDTRGGPESLLQSGSGVADSQYGGVFGPNGAANAPSPFSMFGGGGAGQDFGGAMNLDWVRSRTKFPLTTCADVFLGGVGHLHAAFEPRP